MSTVKISQLEEITHLNVDTANTIFVGVDLPSGITGKFTATTIAEGLYSHNPLKVGNNEILFEHTVGQFSGDDDTYLQVNLQNYSGDGSGDYIVTANTGTNSNSYIDMGLNGESFSDSAYSAMKPYDGYLYVAGPSTTGSSGNLVLGTASSNAQIALIVGGTTSGNIIGYVTKSGIKLNTSKSLTFGDNSTQTSAAAPNSYTQQIYDYANTINAYAYSANTWLQANDGVTLSTSKSYTDSANSWLRANDTVTLSSAKSYTDVANTWLKAYTDTANNWIQSKYLANTTGVFGGSLTLTGDLTTSTGTITANNLHFGTEMVMTSSGLIRTQSGTNNSKNINITAANDLGGFTGGSVTITSGSSTLTNGVAGSINLNAGLGYSSVGSVNVDGKMYVNNSVIFANTQFTATQSALTIAACPISDIQTPSNDGYMIHISGKQNVASRLVIDSFGANTYGLLAGRTARGTPTAPQAVANNDILLRLSGNGYGSTQFAPLGIARIDIVATETYTDAARGSRIEMWNIPNGSNTLNRIATFNGESVVFTGVVNPQKGLILTPNVISGSTTTLNIDIANNSLYKCSSSTGLTVNLSGFQYGKVVELWFVNTGGSTQTVTHGCFANNSTINSTSFSMPASSSAYLRYFSIDGDLANTYVSIQHA